MGTRPCVKALKTNSMIKVAGCEVEPSDGIKNLGITIDNTLSFNKHIGLIFESASFHIQALRQRFSTCGPRTTGGPRPSALWSASKA